MKKWIKVGLVWGFTMFILIVFIFPYLGREQITMRNILLGFVIWLFGGLLFGYTMKKNFKD